MIVLFDANALTATPFHNAWWKVLALASDDWNVQILIPRVSFEEMVAKAERDADKLIKDLAAIANKAGNTSGFQLARADLQERRDAIRANLTEAAAAAGAVLVDPVNVPPMEIVRRQTQRIKPCKESNGDGYRDTLNWLTVLDIATGNPDQEVVWVSQDKDFAASERALHRELIAEAEVAGVADRLTLWPSIGALVQSLLEQRELDSDADAAHLALMIQAIQRYIAGEIPGMLTENGDFTDEDILVIPEADDIEVEQPPTDGHKWGFSVKVYVITASDGDTATGYAHTSGTVTTDIYGKPLAGQITEVEWRLRFMASVGPSELSAIIHLRDQVREAMFPDSLRDQIREAMFPAALRDQVREAMFPPGLRDQVREATFPPGLRAEMQRIAADLTSRNPSASERTSGSAAEQQASGDEDETPAPEHDT
ncbi:PIN domain-containing protein [Actinomadura sp. 3N508]|uniref:PIN domain-containing protein n=1 Tax=Actinomadura sp. 3N508 TaxID=3375153 RepID=UPI0037BDCE09